MELRKANKFVPLSQSGTYAFPVFADGKLAKQWVVVETLTDHGLLVCSCKDGATQRERLAAITTISEDTSIFTRRERKLYCLHARVCDSMKQKYMSGEVEQDDCDDAEEECINIVSLNPLVAVVPSETCGFGIVAAGQSRYKCQSCSSPNCTHLSDFLEWDKNQDTESHEFTSLGETVKTYSTVSEKPIPWPLTKKEQNIFRNLKKCSYPDTLSPQDIPEQCEHSLKYVQYTISENATVHRESVAENGYKIVGFRTKTGCCTIKYDGQEHLLLNVDNKNLVDYEWLFGIMRKSQETQYPLQAAVRAAKTLREDLCPDSLPTTYSLMHKAYNSFTR